MICPYLVNISVLVGGVISWGIMWPYIDHKKGDWYPADLKPSSLRGMVGYRVFISIALILGDGLYNFLKVMTRTMSALVAQVRGPTLPISGADDDLTPAETFDDRRRTEVFLKDQIPNTLALGAYATIAVISIITAPRIFHQLRWYHVACSYIIAPVLAFCNAYGCGLTDWSLATTYGKLAIFMIGAWAGASNGGIIAGLAARGVRGNHHYIRCTSFRANECNETTTSPSSVFPFRALTMPIFKFTKGVFSSQAQRH